MTQTTVKRGVEALYWIHTNEHFEVGTEYKKDGTTPSHIFFRNHFDRMRVPVDLFRSEVSPHIKSNTRKFDTRMYALKPSGRRLIGQ